MNTFYRLLVRAGRVPVFVGALAVHAVGTVVSAVAMSGRRAPAVAFSLALVSAGIVADELAGFPGRFFSTGR